MSQTESARLSGALFDTVVSPLGASRRAAGATPYFPLSADAQRISYFESSPVSVMRPADFEFPGGGTAAGLVDALASHWAQQREPELAAMAPQLKTIAAALREEAALDDGSVDIFCYTLF